MALSSLKVGNRLDTGNAAEHERAQNRYRVRGGSVKVTGNFAGRKETGKRTVVAEHLSLGVGGKAAERVGDGADQGIGEKRRFGDGARPVRLWRMKRPACRQPVTSRCVEPRRVAGCRRVVARDGLGETRRIEPDQARKLAERLGPVGRHFRPDRAFEPGDIEQAAVEDCAGSGPWRLEMNRSRKPLPSLVHEPAAFVEKPPPV